MVTIVSPQSFLSLLVLIPIVLLCLRGFACRQEALRAFHQKNDGVFTRTITKICLLVFSLFFLAAALAHPVLMKSVERQGAHGNYVFLVDTSTSMGARKTLTSASSLETAKKVIADTAREFPDSCVAVFLFSRLAFPVSSLNCDRETLQGIIDQEIRVDRIPYKGTYIANALLVVGDRIQNPASIYHDATHVIVLTDGGDLVPTPVEVQKINAFLSPLTGLIFVGVGDVLGIPIPVLDTHGAFTGQYMQSNGSTYYARLDEEILKNMANQLRGHYFSQGQERELLDFLRKESASHTTKTLHPIDLRLICLAIFTATILALLWRRDL